MHCLAAFNDVNSVKNTTTANNSRDSSSIKTTSLDARPESILIKSDISQLSSHNHKYEENAKNSKIRAEISPHKAAVLQANNTDQARPPPGQQLRLSKGKLNSIQNQILESFQDDLN